MESSGFTLGSLSVFYLSSVVFLGCFFSSILLLQILFSADSISRGFWVDPWVDDVVLPVVSCHIRGETSLFVILPKCNLETMKMPGIRATCPAYRIQWRAMMLARLSSSLSWEETALFVVITAMCILETRGYQLSQSLAPLLPPRCHRTWRKSILEKSAWEEKYIWVRKLWLWIYWGRYSILHIY